MVDMWMTMRGGYVSLSMYHIDLLIKDLPKRYNLYKNQHWAVKNAEAKKWHRIVAAHVIAAGGWPPVPLQKAKVSLIRYSSKAPDYDGLVQSFKPVMDALVRCKVLKDDNMGVIGRPEYTWEKVAPKTGMIRVIVSSV